MSRRANPTLIGSFVIGAVVLAVIGVVLFSSQELFSKRFNVVMFFSGTVAGLNVGAPVNFRGVRVGTVTDVKLISYGPKRELLIPVYADIEPERVVRREGERRTDPRKALADFIKRGLRAQLTTESFVTGLLSVELDFHPDSPVNLVGREKDLIELPTIPSKIELLSQSIKSLRLDELIANVNTIVKDVRKVTGSPETMEAIKSASSALKAVEGLAKTLEAEVGAMTKEMHGSVRDARDTIKGATALLQRIEKLTETANRFIANMNTVVNREVPATAKDIRELTNTAQSAFKKAGNAVGKVDALVDRRSDLRQELSAMLRELAAASRSIRQLSDYLERHPEALVRGKAGGGQ